MGNILAIKEGTHFHVHLELPVSSRAIRVVCLCVAEWPTTPYMASSWFGSTQPLWVSFSSGAVLFAWHHQIFTQYFLDIRTEFRNVWILGRLIHHSLFSSSLTLKIYIWLNTLYFSSWSPSLNLFKIYLSKSCFIFVFVFELVVSLEICLGKIW